ncbi:hypothetical protein [Streptomyces sp. NPDC001380]|uniref:hypothetical protein n=1 Tax=Streptomyces sp. NPDC001380 TaxID=3364566 RepID=UPI003699C7F9
MTERTGRVVLALALAGGVLTGCARADGAAAPAGTVAPGGSAAFDLFTHCGIDEARIGAAWFEAEEPLSDGSGNPPAGWGNPVQHGTMTLRSAAEAVFTDDAGHRVVFRVRPGATGFKRLCA